MKIKQLIDFVQAKVEDVPSQEAIKEAVATVIEENGQAPTIDYSEWFAFQVINELK